MKNIPRKIYLQHGVQDDLTGYDFSELVQVTHSVDRQNKNDLLYIHIDTVQEIVNFFTKQHIDKKYILAHLKLSEDESNKP